LQSGKDFSSASLGYLFVLLAATLWAVSGSAAKFLFRSGVTPFQLVQLRTTIAAAALFLMLFARRRGDLRIGGRDFRYFIFLGVTLALAQFTYLYAISRIHVAAAILLQYQAPVLIAAYTVFVARKRLSTITFAAMSGAVAGCYLMVGAYDLDILHMNRHGIISGLASAAAFALYTVESEYGMRTYSPWTIVFYALLVAALIWNVLHPPLSAFASQLSVSAWGWVAFIGIGGTVLSFGFYNEGVKRIHPARASITATLEPVMAGLFSYAFIGERMEPWQAMGAGLVIASVLLLKMRADHAREEPTT
jgi:drug/metabolite transporter (DMT)-like permease